MRQIFCIISIWLCALNAVAQNEATDSIKAQELDEVVVEAQLQSTSATYIHSASERKSKSATKPRKCPEPATQS